MTKSITRKSEEALTLRARYSAGDQKAEFTVSFSEWRAELPAVPGCHDLPRRDYQLRAILKKANALAGRKVDSVQVLSNLF